MSYDAYKKVLLSSICTTVLGFVPLIANPQGATVVHGKVDIVDNGSTLNVTSHQKHAIIDWKHFNIGKGELTKFSQLDKSSAILNRVTGGDPSKILGAIQSNGKVFLINPNGIVFGADSCINTSAFVASTLQLSLEQFLNSKEFNFVGDSKEAIINYGTINAHSGDVYLLGRVVENYGSITAAEGTVGLGVGQEILLKPESDEHIFIKVASIASDKLENGLTNAGYINALQTELKADGQYYARAIQQNGTINALGVKEQNGRVFLVAEGGSTSFRGSITALNANQTGGEVQILGQQVHLEPTAHINVSGKNGGGVALIGGDFKGSNEQIYNSTITNVEPGAVIEAQATEAGGGGKVIVWANDVNNFAGTVNAKGGNLNGDGGFVEVSGQFLSYQGTVDTRATNGKIGTLLLDPNDITISDAPTSPAYTPPNYDGAGASSANLNRTALNNQLALTNVVISTDVATSGGNGDITVLDGPISGSNSLTLDAYRNLNINQDVVAFGPGATLTANAQTGDVNIKNATLLANSISVTAGQDVNVVGGQSGGFTSLVSTFPGGTLNVTAARDVKLTAISGGANAVWFNPTECPLTITAGRDIIASSSGANTVSITPNGTGSFDATIIAGRNTVLNAGTKVENQTSGALTVVVDNANPSSVGSGFFQLDNGASLATTGGPLRVFTSSQPLEVGKINGILNGQTLTFGTPSAVCGNFREIGGVAYGDSCGSNFLTGTPFTVFYKSGTTPPPLPVINNSVIYDVGKNTIFVKSWDTNYEMVAVLSWLYFSNYPSNLTPQGYSQLLLNLSYLNETNLATLRELYSILNVEEIQLMQQAFAGKFDSSLAGGVQAGIYYDLFNLLAKDTSNEQILAGASFQNYLKQANLVNDSTSSLASALRFVEMILKDPKVGTKENRQKIANLVNSMQIGSLTILELLYLCFVRRRKKLKTAKNL